jgi:hypothetical protein
VYQSSYTSDTLNCYKNLRKTLAKREVSLYNLIMRTYGKEGPDADPSFHQLQTEWPGFLAGKQKCKKGK